MFDMGQGFRDLTRFDPISSVFFSWVDLTRLESDSDSHLFFF
jgi:hypothetical protein